MDMTRRTCPVDCHGLPIELQVDRTLGEKKAKLSTAQFRKECRAYAERFVAIQRDEFKRLGVLGDWTASLSHHGFRLSGGDCSGNWARSSLPVWPIGGTNRCTGASRAGRPSRKPRSSTEEKRSPSITVRFRSFAAGIALPAGSPTTGFCGDLDDDAWTIPAISGSRPTLSSRTSSPRLTASTTSWRRTYSAPS